MSEAGGTQDQGLVNLRWAHALVDGLAAAGVTRAVISPGSRSTPLALACDRHPAIRSWVHLDERGAAFLALGQAKADGMPSLVIATSGSAPAHWYPALLEASLSHIPLLLLSADRPPELQAWGVNQTLDQQKLFGDRIRAFYPAGLPEDDAESLRRIRLFGIRAVERSLGVDPGPVHINLPFREPLIPVAPPSQWPKGIGPGFPIFRQRLALDPMQMRDLATRLAGRPGLIVCGPNKDGAGFAPAVVELADALACPVLADPLSGLRFGPWNKHRLLSRYDFILRRKSVDELPPPAWILRFGAAPVSKSLLGYLASVDARQLLVAPHGDWPDPVQRGAELIRCDPGEFCRGLIAEEPAPGPESSCRAWLELAAEALPDFTAEVADDRPFEGLVIRDLLRALPADSVLFSGNSQPIRQLDSWSGFDAKPLRVFCNRGASGIDGNVATLAGIADVHPGPVVGLIGDLTLLHDLNSLGAARERPLVIIVFNNGGGGIFGQLPQAELDSFQRYWLTPQHLDLQQAARLFGLHYRCIERQGDFPSALAQALAEPFCHLIEVIIDREYSLRRQRAYWLGSTSSGG